jgi:hypothetical protein
MACIICVDEVPRTKVLLCQNCRVYLALNLPLLVFFLLERKGPTWFVRQAGGGRGKWNWSSVHRIGIDGCEASCSYRSSE